MLYRIVTESDISGMEKNTHATIVFLKPEKAVKDLGRLMDYGASFASVEVSEVHGDGTFVRVYRLRLD